MSAARRDDLALILGLAIGLAVLVAFGFAARREAVASANDFSTMWSGARAVLDGEDPYDPARWPLVATRYGTLRSYEDFFGYPPWVALALLPFGLLPVTAAAAAWAAAGIAIAALGLRTLLAAVARGLPTVHTLAGLTILASQPGIGTFWDGQWGWMLAGALAAAATGIVARRSGLLLGGLAMLAKPQLFAFAAWSFVDALRARSDRRGLAMLLGGGAALVVVGSLVLPGWYGDWLGGAFFGRVANATRAPTTIAAALTDLMGGAGAWLAAAAVLGAVGVALAFDRRADASLAVWLALSSTATIYTWSYDHVVLVVPVVIATGVLARRSRRYALGFGTGAFAFLLLAPTLLYWIADVRQDESYSAIVPVVIFLACTIALWPDRRFVGASAA